MADGHRADGLRGALAGFNWRSYAMNFVLMGVMAGCTALSAYLMGHVVNEIYRALAKVKEPLRSCLMLKQQGLSYKEIASSLDLNESSIGTFVARARAEFSRFYAHSGQEKL